MRKQQSEQKITSDMLKREKANGKCKYLDKKLTPSSSSCTLSTLSVAGLETVRKYARGPNEFGSDQ